MNTENTNDQVVQLYLDDIIPNRFQPREVFNDQALKELAISIREHGVIQPILVRKFGEKYEIIAGERRYKASTMAGLTKIPAIVKNLDDKESSKVALIVASASFFEPPVFATTASTSSVLFIIFPPIHCILLQTGIKPIFD